MSRGPSTRTGGGSTPRLQLVLLAVAAGDPVTRDVVAARAGLDTTLAGKGISMAKFNGFVEEPGRKHVHQACVALTDKGRARVAALHSQGVRLPQEQASDQVADPLTARALALVLKAPVGLDSEQLARHLGAAVAQVDAALAPAVAQRRLVTCALVRAGQSLTQYRASSGSTRGTEESKLPGVAQAFRSGMTVEQVQADSQARAESQAEQRRAARLASAPVPAAVPAPAATPALQAPPAPAPHVASEVVDAAPAPVPAARGLPYVGTLDIDAMDRKAAAQQGRPVPGEFICALYSNGALLLDSHGQRLTLPVEHTRRLLHYLEHLGTAAVLAHTGAPA